MRVVVDYDKCNSNALCMAAAPEVFEVRDDNFLYVLQEQPPGGLMGERAPVDAHLAAVSNRLNDVMRRLAADDSLIRAPK